MGKRKNNYERLDQYDYSDGEYLSDVANKYSPLIGMFVLSFSILEHELNVAIAEILHRGTHEIGYVVIEKLSTRNKIELYCNLYMGLENAKNKKDLEKLKNIISQLELMNSFRNNIIHADWQSLSKDGFVRTKISIDDQEGYVKFKKVKMTAAIIRQKIKEVDDLVDQIDEYQELAFQFE